MSYIRRQRSRDYDLSCRDIDLLIEGTMTYLFRDDDDLIERVFAKGIPTFAGHDRNTVIP